jgi:hypothetical protein
VCRLASLACMLLLLTKGSGKIPEGRSEHSITVGGADGSRRQFVVKNPKTAPSRAVLLLHDSTRHPGGDGLAPVRDFERRLGDVADLWAANGALLVFLAGREVGSFGQFCWGAGHITCMYPARSVGACVHVRVLLMLRVHADPEIVRGRDR